MSETSRRQTRSQSALSRGHTPETVSTRDESQPPPSIQSRTSARRSAATKPLLPTETSTTYGSRGQRTLAQQLPAAESTNTVNVIQTQVTSAEEAVTSRRLSIVNEEGAEDDVESEHASEHASERANERASERANERANERASVIDHGNVSERERDLLAAQLTGRSKSFQRETVDESDSDIPPRDGPSGSYSPTAEEPSFLARLRAYTIRYLPILGLLFLLLAAIIAFTSVAMWVGWRPLDGRLAPGEYNKSFVRGEFVKMTHTLEARGLELMERLNSHDRQISERLESQDRQIRDRSDSQDRQIQERSDSQDRQIQERSDSQDRQIRERSDSRDREMWERIESQDRDLMERNANMLEERDRRLNALLTEEHRVLEQLKNDVETVDLKFREPSGPSRINWFSRGFAAISTRFTSPTLAYPLTWTEKLASVRFELGQLPQWQTERPMFEDPMSIFNPWDSFGQKWCAPSRRGKLQAVVRLAYSIAPTDIQIEHMKQSEMPDLEIGTAPKEVELWIQVLDPDVRQTVLDAIEEFFPLIMYKEASQRGKTIDPNLALDRTWVPVGRWDYDIHRLQNKQAFLMPFNLAHLGVKTRAVALRVNSNWGSTDSTCLYRVRLYGTYMDPPTHFTDLELISDEDPYDEKGRFAKNTKPVTKTRFSPWSRWYAKHPRTTVP